MVFNKIIRCHDNPFTPISTKRTVIGLFQDSNIRYEERNAYAKGFSINLDYIWKLSSVNRHSKQYWRALMSVEYALIDFL